MKRLLLVTFALLLTATVAMADPGLPQTIVLSPSVLKQNHQRVADHDPSLMTAYAKLLREAGELLAKPAPSVTDKPRTLPGMDPHEYVSISPYWWPDTTKPDGLPYVRRDGERNPESTGPIFDSTRMQEMAFMVETLALAYWFTGDERFAAKGAAVLRTWFLAPQTAMNPNLEHAQIRPGHKHQPSGIIVGNVLPRAVDAALLLEGSSHWNRQDATALRGWFSRLLHWMRTSSDGREEAARPNNRGSWYAAQAAVYARYVGDSQTVTAMGGKGRQLISLQSGPDGSQPMELKRAQPLKYSFFNLKALYTLAAAVEHSDSPLWHYRTGDGKSLRKMTDRIAPCLAEPAHCPGIPAKKFDPWSYTGLLRRASIVYTDASYDTIPDRLPQEREARDRTKLAY